MLEEYGKVYRSPIWAEGDAVVVRDIAEEQSIRPAAPMRWEQLSLERRFAVLAICLSVVSTLVLGTWISEKIEQTARAREAGSAAVYIGHFISPLVQDLNRQEGLSQDQIAELDTIMRSAALRLRVVAMKVWNTQGQIIYSSNRQAIGDIFAIEGALEQAINGSIASEFDRNDAESQAEYNHGDVLLEIYAPLRSNITGEVVAVAEFYEIADDLKADLTNAQMQSWIVTCVVLISIFAAFSTIIADGSRTIDQQRRELTNRIAELSDAMLKRKELRERIERGARGVIEDNERFLKMVGSDLHDGPAQLIGLAQLRLDSIQEFAAADDFNAIRTALKGAMRDIRCISAGLLLPNIEDQDIVDCVKAMIRDHEMKTQTHVVFKFEDMPKECPHYVKICLCRFVQEGLANAFRHAQAKDQTVIIERMHDGIRAQVTDSGPGLSGCEKTEYGAHLGLIGLRGRLESIRGSLSISSNAGTGTILTAWLPLEVSVPNGT